MHRVCTVYVCNKWPYELWMREYEGEAVHPQVLHSTDRLLLFVHFLLPHELFSSDLVAFSWEDCVPSQHGGYYLGCGQDLGILRFKQQQNPLLCQIFLMNICWANATGVNILPDVLLLYTWMHPLI